MLPSGGCGGTLADALATGVLVEVGADTAAIVWDVLALGDGAVEAFAAAPAGRTGTIASCCSRTEGGEVVALAPVVVAVLFGLPTAGAAGVDVDVGGSSGPEGGMMSCRV